MSGIEDKTIVKGVVLYYKFAAKVSEYCHKEKFRFPLSVGIGLTELKSELW